MVMFRALPELRFALDDMLAHEMHINEIISDLHKNEPPDGVETDE
jgi:ribosome-binding factor A